MKTNSNDYVLKSPVVGKLINLESVPDPVFAQKMMGEGLAIIPHQEIIVAPASGTVSLISPTKHAFGMILDSGLEILIHIGIDTVNLKGNGFEVLVAEGTEVSQGTPIIKIDINYIKENGIQTVTPMIMLNHSNFTFSIQSECEYVDYDSTLVVYNKN